MAEVTFMKTTSGKIKDLPIVDGQITVTSDIPSIYWDGTNSRIKFTDILDVETESDRENILAPIAKYYFVTETGTLYRYLNGDWLKMATKSTIVDTIESFTPTANQSVFTLSKNAYDSNVQLYVNGLLYQYSSDYSLNSEKSAVNWLATSSNGGFDMKSTFTVDIAYSYLI